MRLPLSNSEDIWNIVARNSKSHIFHESVLHAYLQITYQKCLLPFTNMVTEQRLMLYPTHLLLSESKVLYQLSSSLK